MNRRSFLAASLAAAAASRAATIKRIDSSRISAITDECSRSQAESIDFAHKFGMQWLSLRWTFLHRSVRRGSRIIRWSLNS